MPVPKEVVEAQLQAFRQVHTQAIVPMKSKEAAELPNILHAGEVIHAITQGTKEGSATRWLLVLTDRRVLSLDKGFFGKLSMVELPLDSIQGVSHNVGVLVGEITIATGGPAWRMVNVLKSLTAPFANALAELLNRRGRGAGPNVPSVDVVGQLERLAQLRSAGHLTDAEFEVQKQRVLAGG